MSFRLCDQVRLKPVCSATETGQLFLFPCNRIRFSNIEAHIDIHAQPSLKTFSTKKVIVFQCSRKH